MCLNEKCQQLQLLVEDADLRSLLAAGSLAASPGRGWRVVGLVGGHRGVLLQVHAGAGLIAARQQLPVTSDDTGC